MTRHDMRENEHAPFRFDLRRVEDTGHHWVGIIAVVGSSFLMGYALASIVQMIWRAFQ